MAWASVWQNVAAWLATRGIVVEPYFGSLDNELRLEAEHKLQTNQIKALVATTALGMGYDKPDLSFVVHFQSPGSPVAYYQQVVPSPKSTWSTTSCRRSIRSTARRR